MHPQGGNKVEYSRQIAQSEGPAEDIAIGASDQPRGTGYADAGDKA